MDLFRTPGRRENARLLLCLEVFVQQRFLPHLDCATMVLTDPKLPEPVDLVLVVNTRAGT